MKKVILAAALLLTVSGLKAQWRITGIDKSENTSCELVRILESDSATFVFGTITNPSDDLYPYSTVLRTTCVYVDDEPYRLLNSVNLPIYDEATPLYAQISGHQKLNFIMQFEKFPVTDGFDLLEKESKHTEGTYNFYGIHVENEGIENMEGDSFTDEYPSVLYGDFSREGKATQFYVSRNLTLSCTRDIEYRDQYAQPDYVFFLSFENGSRKDLDLNFEKDIWVTGHSVRSNGREEEKKIKLIRPDEYESYFYWKDYDAARYIVNGDVAGLSDAVSEARNSTFDSDKRTVLGLFELVGDLSIDEEVREYMEAHPSDRPAALNGCTIKAGEKKDGYVAVQTRKMDRYVLHIRLDGYEYRFNWKK